MKILTPQRPDLDCATTAPDDVLPDEIVELLATNQEGRLSYQSGRGPRSIVVNYRVGDGGVLMTLPDYNDAAHCIAGRTVTFETAGQSPRRGRWAVTATGTAHRLAGEPSSAAASASSGEWPSWVMTSVFLLAADDLRWRMDEHPLPT